MNEDSAKGQKRKTKGDAYESFSGVGEWYRSLAWGVDNHKEIDAGCDTGDTIDTFGGIEAEARDEQHDSHKWEGYEKEVASTKGINRIDS